MKPAENYKTKPKGLAYVALRILEDTIVTAVAHGRCVEIACPPRSTTAHFEKTAERGSAVRSIKVETMVNDHHGK